MNRVALGELVEIKGGGTPDKSVAEYWDGDIPWASVKDFKSGILDRTIDKISQRGVASSATQVIPAGSIIVPTRMAVGKVAINTIALAINQDLKALTPKSGVDTRFLYHALLANGSKLEEQATGATVKGIKLDVLRNLKIPLPPLEEQKRIAAILDQADTLRRLRRRALDRLNTLGQAIFHEMFAPSKASAWPIVDLGQLATNRDGARIPLKKEDRAKRSGWIPYYGASGVIDYIDNFIFEGTHLLIGEDGANLLARSSPVAFIADGHFWVNNHAHVLQGNGKAELEYLRCYIEAIDLEPYITGSAQPKLNQKQLNRIPIVLPPLSLQSAFVAAIALASKERNKAAVACEKSEQLFTSLQHRAFRGEL